MMRALLSTILNGLKLQMIVTMITIEKRMESKEMIDINKFYYTAEKQATCENQKLLFINSRNSH